MHSTPTIDRMLELETVAVVGVSRDRRQIANVIFRTLRDGGRTVYAVNSRAGGETLEGEPAHASLRDLPAGVEGVFLVLPADAVADVVREALDLGLRHIWIPRGIGGAAPPADVVDEARRRGADVVAGECPLMFTEPVRGIHRIHRRFHRAAA